jgi:hypothetical protein
LEGGAAVASDLTLPEPAPGYPLPPAYTLVAPAVSQVNYKVDFRSMFASGRELYGGVGSVSMPLATSYGFQADGIVGSLDGELFGGVAGHLFWRNPAHGLIGVYADVVSSGAANAGTVGRFAGEFEYYRGNLTFSALIGAQFGDASDGLFTKERLSLYSPDGNLEVYLGHAYLPGDVGHSGIVGAEWLISHAYEGLALFGEGRFSEHGDWGGKLGVRFYLGPSKSLRDRHRQDDPGDHFDLYGDAVSEDDDATAIVE